MTDPSVPQADTRRALFYEQLHQAYAPNAFDNWVVWAGNLSVFIGGVRQGPTLARAYIGAERPSVEARVRVELFVAAVDPLEVRPGDVDVRLWTDANQREAARSGRGRHLPMRLVCDGRGVPRLAGSNLVFESEVLVLDTTGVFGYTAAFSADALGLNHPRKQWLSINAIGPNQDGVLVVSPQWVADGPSIVEVCPRKVGAGLEGGRFRSGTLDAVTRELERLPADVVYLLPFFEPGFMDLHTGEDVRKGSLGSVYAVRDFFRLDPQLVTDEPLGTLVDDLLDVDLDDLLDADQRRALPDLAALAAAPADRLQQLLPRQTRRQLCGRAQLRRLVHRAHTLGKRVIFDLILMQTSRDNPLIESHPEWYVRDAEGRPSIHRIAWLVYSDVALFDLTFNAPLQDYLLQIAPYWIERFDLDGVRIDASQTVDRPFLKRLKNRINAARPDALVLGETLCALDEAVDIPVDMIYALMVDFHRDAEHAGPLTDFLEEMHARFAAGTMAHAYFENHDSPRATQVWHERYTERLQQDEDAKEYWTDLTPTVPTAERPLLMALLKNLQATLIDATAGAATGSNLAYGLEWGSDWGEENRTDFENPTLLQPAQRDQGLRQRLHAAYADLHRQVKDWPEARRGKVYYQRNAFAGGDAEDRILAYVRYTPQGALLALHNLDAAHPRRVTYAFDYLPVPVAAPTLLFDTYAAFTLPIPTSPTPGDMGHTFAINPLQTQIWRLY